MTTQPTLLRRTNGFTLIELLTVISIIAMLAAGSFAGYNKLIESARKKQAATMLQTLVNAIENYNGDYNQYPEPTSGGSGSDVQTDTSPEEGIVQTLIGQDPERNRRATDYLGSLPEAVNDKSGSYKNGLLSQENSFGIYDPWGSPYDIWLDLDYDKEINNPDSANGNTTLRKQVIGFSRGIDKQDGTWDDNIASWKQ